jgi:hypothetical protein
MVNNVYIQFHRKNVVSTLLLYSYVSIVPKLATVILGFMFATCTGTIQNFQVNFV